MLSTLTSKDLETGLVPEFDIPLDPEVDGDAEGAKVEPDAEPVPAWEEFDEDTALNIAADGRKSGDDEESDPDEFDDEPAEEDEFGDEDFEEDEDELDEDFDDFEFDEEEEEEEDL